MTDDELESLLDELEAGFAEDVQAALTLTAREFATAVNGADELVAASFSVRRIGDMWRRRVPGLISRLMGIARRGGRATSETLDEPAPPAAELNRALIPYADATESLLDQVGDRLAADAVRALADGMASGDTLDQLKDRLTAVFSSDGSELGPTRAQRIAATETTRAYNAGALAAARSIGGLGRPVVKQWLTRNDTKVREAHADTNGQIQFLDDPFDVGGTPMQYPGDPTAPASLTVNCRCILRAEAAPQPADEGTDVTEDDGLSAAGGESLQSRMPEKLKDYWLDGEGAARIGWGTPGAFERCVAELGDKFPQDTEGLCANLYHEATGRWPGQDRASGEVHTGAMIALMPSAADAERLAVLGGEAADQLHLTLYYLGDAVDWPEESRQSVRHTVQSAVRWLAPVRARAFGVAQWNPASDSPVWVWNVGDDHETGGSTLAEAYAEVVYALEDGGTGVDMPRQHSPWSPHVCALYGEPGDTEDLTRRLGPVVFDRIRVAFGGEYTDFPLIDAPAPVELDEPDDLYEGGPTASPDVVDEMPSTVDWITPEGAGLAFENQQTGDGRVFADGALYWEGEGPWPLQYAEQMLGGHDGARLAGSISGMALGGGRLHGAGSLYLNLAAGAEAAMLLARRAPLGVSVDLDDVDLQMIDATGETFTAHLMTASFLPGEDGWTLTGETDPELYASSDSPSMAFRTERVTFHGGPDGRVPAAVFDLVAAAGDAGVSGTVVDEQRSGDYIMRITRARVRGATLVAIPAFAGARIELVDPPRWLSASDTVTAAAATSDYDRVVRHVRKSVTPVDAAAVAKFLKLNIVAVRRFLARAAQKGDLVRLTRGKYVAPTEVKPAGASVTASSGLDLDELVASVTGSVDLPVADRDTEWDGAGAKNRVFEWADGDTARIGRAFAYRDDDADPETKGAYKLGYADVLDGDLVIVPAGVSAAIGALHGARGGVDLPEGERDAVRARLEEVAAHVAEETGEDDMNDMQASAWTALKDVPPFPAEWFREPTAEELPPGGPGVNYANGRIFGWVAQAGEAHAGYAKKVTIDALGRIDTTRFLRQRFTLDDGSTVKAGAYTMNVGHHRDGAECETASCQFDDTRTVAGIVTVGMNERGMWFSGAAAPWLSEWDRAVFKATQPSYHMKRGANGNWQLRAVLSVPVPGHASPLLASAVIERSQLALTAAAGMAEVEEAVAAVNESQADGTTALMDLTTGIDYDRLADAMVAAMHRADELKAAQEAELEALRAEALKLDSDSTDEGN